MINLQIASTDIYVIKGVSVSYMHPYSKYIITGGVAI